MYVYICVYVYIIDKHFKYESYHFLAFSTSWGKLSEIHHFCIHFVCIYIIGYLPHRWGTRNVGFRDPSNDLLTILGRLLGKGWIA